MDNDLNEVRLQPLPATPLSASGTREPDLADQFAGDPRYKKAEKAAGAYAEALLERNGSGRSMILRETARRRIISTAVFSLALFITLSLMMLYHRSYWIFILVFAALGIGYFVSRADNKALLAKKLASMPQADMENVLMSDMDHMVGRKANSALRAGILAVFLALFVVLFWSPRMIFEKGDSGYSLRYYSAAIRPEADVILPDTWNGVQVTEIRGNVFQGLRSIERVVLPQHLIRIRAHAFRDCKNLRKVVFPSTIKSIGSSAFRNCERLYVVTLPSGCDVDSRAFKNSGTRIEWK